jgi:hypothetical protein
MTAERVRHAAAGREIRSRAAAVPCAGSTRPSGRLRTGRDAMAGMSMSPGLAATPSGIGDLQHGVARLRGASVEMREFSENSLDPAS